MKPSIWISAVAIALFVTGAIYADMWLLVPMAAAGAAFVAVALVHPRAALLLWLFLAPFADAYAHVSLPVGLPDITFGRVTIAMVVIALLFQMILKGRRFVPIGNVEFAMLVLLAIMTGDIMRSGNPTSDALQDFDERVIPILLFLAARNLFTRRVDVKYAVSILAAVGCYLALHGVYQYVTFAKPDPTGAAQELEIHEGGQRVNESHLGEGRAVGPFTSAVEYGSVAAITFISALFLALYETRGIVRVVVAATLPLIGAAVVMSSTRSTWLGGFVAVLLMALLDRRRRTFLIAGVVATMAAGLLAAVLFLPQESNLEERASSLEPVRARLVMYNIGLKIGIRKPLTGYGRGAPSRTAARKELFASGSPDADLAAGQFHNIFMMTFVEWGLIALAAYVAILLLLMKAALRLRRESDESSLTYHFAGLFLGTLAIYVIQGLLVDTPPFLYLNGVFFFLAGVMHAQLDTVAVRSPEAQLADGAPGAILTAGGSLQP